MNSYVHHDRLMLDLHLITRKQMYFSGTVGEGFIAGYSKTWGN